jgi:beta-mannosidase
MAVMNSGLAPRDLSLSLRVFAFDGRLLAELHRDVRAPASGTVESTQPLSVGSEPVVAELRALEPGRSEEVARDCAWTEPFRFYRLDGATVRITAQGAALRVSADRPVKGLWLSAPGLDVDDNFVDLVPGDERIIATRIALPTTLTAVALDLPAWPVRLPGGEG